VGVAFSTVSFVHLENGGSGNNQEEKSALFVRFLICSDAAEAPSGGPVILWWSKSSTELKNFY
jgi:hypothetical protein